MAGRDVAGRLARWQKFHTAATAFRRLSSGMRVWLYLRFTLTYRDVEELLAERGLDISYQSLRKSSGQRVKAVNALVVFRST
jgi:transposase-like protein